MARRVHRLQGQAPHAQHGAVGDDDVRRRLRRLPTEAPHLLDDGPLLRRDIDVLGDVGPPVAQGALLLGVHDDLRPCGLPYLVRSAGVVEVVMGEDDVAQLDVRPLPQVVQPGPDRLLVAEAAVDEGAFAAVGHQVDARRLGPGIEAPGRRDRVNARGYLQGCASHSSRRIAMATASTGWPRRRR